MTQNFYQYCARDEAFAKAMLEKLVATVKPESDKDLAEILAYARDLQGLIFSAPEEGMATSKSALGKFLDLTLLNSFNFNFID